MKTKIRPYLSWTLAISAALLFDDVSYGLNASIFSSLSVLALLFLYSEIPLQRKALAILPHLCIALYLSLYPQALSVFFWYLSYLLMWSMAAVSNSSLLLPFQGIAAMVGSPFKHWAPKPSPPQSETLQEQEAKRVQNTNRWAVILLVSIIALTFAFLYALSNPIFSNILEDIQWPEIEADLVWSSLGIYLLLYGLLRFYKIDAIDRINELPKSLVSADYPKEHPEFPIAKWSLLIVSGMLLVMNLTDLVVIFSGKLPSGMSYSKYVHQGFYSLIFSMALALGLMMIFFRGALNFHDHVHRIRQIARFWIIQNLALALITAYKNLLYVEVYGLTYKRIGVFACLLAVSLGLALMIRKINHARSNWYFFNRLSALGYALIMIYALIPYDLWITRYNLRYAQSKDLYYIQSLARPDLVELEAYMQKMPEGPEEYRYTREFLNRMQESVEYKAAIQSWREWNWYQNNVFRTFKIKK
tara:strand:- start:986 stop:2404 length:1419 start_codon:yes stop_codon:yes gene_type:complete